MSKFRLLFFLFLFPVAAFAQFRAFPGTPMDARRDIQFSNKAIGFLMDVNGDSLLDHVVGGANHWDGYRWTWSFPGVWEARKNFGFQLEWKKYHQPKYDPFLHSLKGSGIIALDFPSWDIDGDGKTDGFLLYSSKASETAKNHYALLARSTGKRIALKTNFLNCANAIGGTMLQGDFNGDGHNDFYVLTYEPNTGTYVPFLGIWEKPGKFVDYASKAFPLALPYKQNGFYQAAIDLEGDGDLDLMFFPYDEADNTPVVLENDGKAHFKIVKKKFTAFAKVARGIYGGVAADLDGDGDQDLVLNTYYPRNWSSKLSPPCRIWWNDGKGNFPTETYFHVPEYNAWTLRPLVFDYDLDGDLDVIYPQSWGSNFRINTVLYENKGKHVFVEHKNALQPLSMQDAAVRAVAIDIDHDGDMDLFMHLKVTLGARYFFNTHHQLCVPKDPVIGKPFRLDFYVKPGPRVLLAELSLKRLPQGLPVLRYGKWWLDPGSMFLVGRVFCFGTKEEHPVDVPIPGDRRLLGLKLYSQGLVVDFPTHQLWGTTFFENVVRAK